MARRKRLTVRVKELEELIVHLKDKIEELEANVEESAPAPHSKVGGPNDRALYSPIGPVSGWNGSLGGPMIWNDAILKRPAFGVKPDMSVVGYNQHAHSRFSGGALEINTLEIVEYDIALETTPETGYINLYEWNDAIYSKHCSDFWPSEPAIKTSQNTDGENIPKIGMLDITFNPDTKKWEAGGADIDVKTTNFVMRDSNGDIELDANGNEMSAPLWNEDSTKSAVVWDVSARVWRFFATYSD